MKSLRGRAKLKGKPLNKECRKARTESWKGDTYCCGLTSPETDDYLNECWGCGAFVLNDYEDDEKGGEDDPD